MLLDWPIRFILGRWCSHFEERGGMFSATFEENCHSFDPRHTFKDCDKVRQRSLGPVENTNTTKLGCEWSPVKKKLNSSTELHPPPQPLRSCSRFNSVPYNLELRWRTKKNRYQRVRLVPFIECNRRNASICAVELRTEGCGRHTVALVSRRTPSIKTQKKLISRVVHIAVRKRKRPFNETEPPSKKNENNKKKWRPVQRGQRGMASSHQGRTRREKEYNFCGPWMDQSAGRHWFMTDSQSVDRDVCVRAPHSSTGTIS